MPPDQTPTTTVRRSVPPRVVGKRYNRRELTTRSDSHGDDPHHPSPKMRIPWLSNQTPQSEATQPPPPSSQPQPSQQPELLEPASPPISSLSHPTALSCRSLFDQAFFCQSPAGQFLSVYRYKSIRSCSDIWADFRFCITTKNSLSKWAGDGVAAEAVEQRFREREERTYRTPGARSSDEVWVERRVSERLETAWDQIPPME